MKALILALVFCWVMIPPANGWDDEVDRFVASLNSPEVQQALGLKQVRRPERIENRLDVIFGDHLSPSARSQVLNQIAQEFHSILFRRQSIPVAIVVERNAAGRVISSLVVNVSGRPIVGPETVPQPRDPC